MQFVGAIISKLEASFIYFDSAANAKNEYRDYASSLFLFFVICKSNATLIKDSQARLHCGSMSAKQMGGYSGGCTRTGDTIRCLERGTGLSNLPVVSGCHTSGVTWRKASFLPFSTLMWRSWVQTPWPAKVFSARNLIAHYFPMQLVWCYLDPSFLLFLFTLESLCKLYIIPTLLHADFPIFLFYPIHTSPVRVIPSLSVLCGYLKKLQQPLFAITSSALPSSYFNLLACLVGRS